MSSESDSSIPEISEDPSILLKKKAQAVEIKEKGNTAYKAKKFDEAIAAYDEAYSIDPSNVMVLNNKAAVLIEQGKYQEAISLCEDALEKGKSQRISYEDKAKIYNRIAAAHLKLDDIPSALKAYGKAQMEIYDKATERKIKNLELEQTKLEKQRYIDPVKGLEAKELGNVAFREGRFPDAINHYEEAVKRDPTNAAYYNNLAAALLKMGVFEDAKRKVEKSLELDPKYVKAWAKKGDIEFYMKEYHRSMDSYKAGLQIDSENTLCKQGLMKTMKAISEGNNTGNVDQERAAHAMADPEIQAILSDPTIRQILTDFQENPAHAQRALAGDASIRAKFEKLIASGILQVK